MTAGELLLEPDAHPLYPLLGAYSIGYMASDLIDMALAPRHARTHCTPTAVAHHSLVIAANLCCYVYGFAWPLMTLAYVEELSTLFLNLPAVLAIRKPSFGYSLCKALFAMTFLLSRFSVMWVVVLNIPRLWLQIHQYQDHPDEHYHQATRTAFLIMAAVLITMRLLNTYWLVLIVKKLV
jgi:hypothetical protein